MRNLIRISDAAVLAIHALAVLAFADAPVPASRLAEMMGVSEAHLSKVLQRLARIGIISSLRGPKGGFTLERAPEEVTLLELFVAIDGPLAEESCFLGTPVCNSPTACPIRGLSHEVRELVTGRLGQLTLRDLDLSELIPTP